MFCYSKKSFNISEFLELNDVKIKLLICIKLNDEIILFVLKNLIFISTIFTWYVYFFMKIIAQTFNLSVNIYLILNIKQILKKRRKHNVLNLKCLVCQIWYMLNF